MTGELISICVSALWTASALFFEYAGKKIKAMNLNLIRLVFACLLLGIILFSISGSPFPKMADGKTWLWMSLSGFVGFVFGDFFLFSSYRVMPARFTQLIMTLAPLFAAISGYLILGERLTHTALLGMVVTLSGIAISILKRSDAVKTTTEQTIHTPQQSSTNEVNEVHQNDTNTSPETAHAHHLRVSLADGIHSATSHAPAHAHHHLPHEALQLSIPTKGVIFALLAAIGQGVGLVLSKHGMQFYEQSVRAQMNDADLATGADIASGTDFAMGADIASGAAAVDFAAGTASATGTAAMDIAANAAGATGTAAMDIAANAAGATGADLAAMYIPLAATQIRIITGIVCFIVIIAFMRSFRSLFASFREKKSIAAAFGGAIVGPVVGVSLSLLAVQHANTAIASTLMALAPIIILIPDRFLYKRRVTFIEVLGAIISVCGVAILLF